MRDEIRRAFDRPSIRLAVACAIVWWIFAFRLATPGFLNDDFDHLSKARQMLYGEWPDRDFYDDGRPLTILASAAAQWIDPTLLSEFILRAGTIALGGALVFFLAHELTRSMVMALVAVVFSTAVAPRLYNYPKILLFPLTLWLLWRYVDRPDRRRLMALAGITIVAGLFRHDYGLYVAVICGLTLAARHARAALRPLVLYSVVVTAGVSPYLGWLLANHRLVQTGVGGVGALVARMPGLTRVPLHLDLTHGLYRIGPEPPRVTVRWREGVSLADQAAIEEHYGLHQRDRKSDGRSVLYTIDEQSPVTVLQLVTDARVEDTGGIDRGNGQLLPLSGWSWWTWRIPLLRLEASTLFHTPEDAQGWIYYVFLVAPFLAAYVAWRWPDPMTRGAGAKMLALIACAVIIDQVIVLGQLGPRLPDVAGVMGVLLVWLAWRVVGVSWTRTAAAGLRTIVAGVVVALLTVITWRAVVTSSGNGLQQVVMAGVESPATLVDRARELHQRPLTYWLTEKRVSGRIEGVPALVAYLAACLTPEDRPLVVGYAPEVYYLSERLFAGGINRFDGAGFNPSSAEILRWLRGQSVPLVIVEVREAAALNREWADLGVYVRRRYRLMQETTFGGSRPFRILADSQRAPRGLDPRWGLPCFVDVPASP